MQISMFAARSPWELKAPPDIVEELNDYVVKRLKELREKENSGSHLSSKGCPNDSNDSPLLQSHCNTFNSVDCHPTSSTCDKEDAERQRSPSSDHCTTTATAEAGEEYGSMTSEANAELKAKSEEKSGTSASERISSEYPHIINEAAATCTKPGEESPAGGTLIAVSGGTCDDLTDWSPGLTDRVIEDQDVNVHKQKAAGHQQHCPVSSKEATAHSSADRILINDTVTANQNKRIVYNQTNCKNTGKDVSSGVCSQVDLSPTCAECTPLSGPVDKDSPSMTVLKDPQYEDISDAEDIVSELHEEFHFPLRLEDPDYEDISEDENPPIQNMDVEEMPSARRCSCPRFDDNTECVSSAVCDRAECGPSSDMKEEDKTDDEMDDDWDIIPLIITEVTLELPEDEPDPEDVSDVDEEHVDNVTLCELHQPPPVQVPASAFSQIEVFDTCESFQLAKAVQFGKFPQNLSEESLPPEREPKAHHSRRVSYYSEDSCETDDSCNYSHVEERNHLTVSAKLLNSMPARSLTSSDSDSNDKVDDVVTNRQNYIIVLNSDTEDECDQVCTNDARRQKRLFSQDKVSAATPCRPRKRYSSETSVKENSSKEQLSDGESVIVIDSDEDDSSQNYKANWKREFCSEWAGAGEYESAKYESDEGKVEECRQSADLVQHDSRDSQHSPEEMQDTCSDLPHRIKRGQLPEAETGSVCVQQKTNTQMTSSRFHESKHVVKADKLVKKKAKTKRRRRQSLEPGDCDSAFINVLLKRPRVSSKSQQNQSSKDSVIQEPNPPQSGTDREADTTAVACSPVIPRLSIQNFAQDNRTLKLCKQSVAYRRDKDASPKKHPTSKNLHSCQTKTQLLHGDTQGKFVSNPKPADERHPEQCLTHVTALSKESSSPPTKKSPLFSLQRPDPLNSIPSTSIPSYAPTKGPSAMTQVTNKWRESYYSTRKDKKTSVVMEEGLRPKNNHDLPKESKPGRSHCDRPPRRRNSSQESATPLMKRTIVEARELTKARNRDASWDQLGHRVGEGYKWRK